MLGWGIRAEKRGERIEGKERTCELYYRDCRERETLVITGGAMPVEMFGNRAQGGGALGIAL